MRHCLIIDDTKQEEEMYAIEMLGKNAAFPITCHYFNPLMKECLRKEEKDDGSVDYLFDEELVLDQLRKKFSSQHLDLIATDYTFQGVSKNGLDLLSYLKKEGWKGKTPYVIYSGDSHEIKEKLQSKIRAIVENKNELNTFIEDYSELNPAKVFERSEKAENSHVGRIYEFIKKHKTPLNSKLSQKLCQHPDKVFKNIFPRFENKPLHFFSELVTKNTEESDDFENEFLDRCVDHFIDLKE